MSTLIAIKSTLGVRGLGCRPDGYDPRDKAFSELLLGVTSAPRSVSLEERMPLTGALDQQATQACVGYSWALALWLEMAGLGFGELFMPSPHAIYFWARAYVGMQRQDSGAMLRDAPRALAAFGFPTSEAWPSKPYTVNVQPSILALRSANDRRRLAGYYRIPRGDTDSMRLAIAAGHPVVFGLKLRSSFLDGNEPVIDRDTGSERGGHAMVALGYDGRGFRVASSWGPTWRERGLCWISERRMQEAMDAWVARLRTAA
jgi:hypothetical protein